MSSTNRWQDGDVDHGDVDHGYGDHGYGGGGDGDAELQKAI